MHFGGAVLLPRFFLGQADTGGLRLGEDHPGHGAVVELPGHVEDGISDGDLGLVLGGVREQVFAGDVAASIDVARRGAAAVRPAEPPPSTMRS